MEILPVNGVPASKESGYSVHVRKYCQSMGYTLAMNLVTVYMYGNIASQWGTRTDKPIEMPDWILFCLRIKYSICLHF